MTILEDNAHEAAIYIKQRIVEYKDAKVAIICGSGLAGLADDLRNITEIAYKDIPHFATSTVQGHASKLVYGFIVKGDHRVPVLAMVGRFHAYEGYSLQTTTFPIRVFSKLNIPILIATNAAGGLNPEYDVGDICVLSDFLNVPGLAGQHPLVGPNETGFGERFTPLSDTCDFSLRQALFRAAQDLNITRRIHEGVYAYVSGPTYETRAECRMLRMFADVVGMSTVPEIIVARHCGIKVLALSLVTNKAVIDVPASAKDLAATDTSRDGIANHDEVVEAGKKAALDMQSLIATVVAGLT